MWQAIGRWRLRLRAVTAHRTLRRTRRLAMALLLLYSTGKALPHLWPRSPLRGGFGSSVAVHAMDGTLLRLTLATDDTYRLWTPLSHISPRLRRAVQLYEDRHFRYHPGINPAALVRAAWATYVRDQRRIGGSTITMQLARRLFDIDSRTVGGKLRQIGRALQLELLYTKDEILEAYLNLAPMGSNIEGVGAAAWIYFGKPPDHLTLGEVATLAVIPQNPGKRGACSAGTEPTETRAEWRSRSGVRSGAHPWAHAARMALLAGWTDLSDEERALARLPLSLRCPTRLPFGAPHFVERVLARQRRTGHSRTGIRTTLDSRLQRLVQRQLHDHLRRLGPLGLKNGAVLLVDRRTRAIRATVGSAAFHDATIHGQVDGTRARRSPASTIKPLLYALALEQGLIHPRTLVVDRPTHFGGYHPENFDRRFSGPLTAEQALVRSRNIPAVELAQKLRAPGLHGLLRRAGIGHLGRAEHHGLSLALGGFEMTMEELATLYAALGNGGQIGPLVDDADAPTRPVRRLLSPEASFITVQMLLHNPRPDQLAQPLPTRDRQARVAWKTGTSFGYRDAWSVGLFGPYVLVVWLGNFSGEGTQALVGLTAAAPLFFSIVDAIAATHGPLQLQIAPPPGVKHVEVCAVSGQLPSEHCPHRHRTWYIPGRSPIQTCQVHRQIRVDRSTGLRVCQGGVSAELQVHEFWPTDLARLFAAAGVPRRPPPAPGPGCSPLQRFRRGTPPRILSPDGELTYAVGQRAGRGRIPLTAAVDADVRQLHWFAGQAYLGRGPSDRPLWWRPRAPGTYVVRAIDDAGRSDVRRVRVIEPEG